MSDPTKIKWRIAGEEVVNCNCSWGCPCQFNALPTTGNCEAIVVWQIREGYPAREPIMRECIDFDFGWLPDPDSFQLSFFEICQDRDHGHQSLSHRNAVPGLNPFFGDSPGNGSDDGTVGKLELRILDLRQSGFGLGTRSFFLSVGDLQVFPGNIHGCQVRFLRSDAGFGLRLSCVEVLFRNKPPNSEPRTQNPKTANREVFVT
jgi:hypothetical protein